MKARSKNVRKQNRLYGNNRGKREANANGDPLAGNMV